MKAAVTLAALCFALNAVAALADDAKPVEANPAEAKPAEAEKPPVTGNPPADSPFAKVKPGMKFDEATAILGKPTSERAFCTQKHYIPFYMGRDRAYTEYYYKDQGVVVFYTDISTWGIGRYKHCTPKQPTELAEVHYNVSEAGVAPKDEGEVKKETAEAAK
jgi:outer membrane protein assembly factor BamE (lipoprotein component of BamABCDE complex)